MSWLSTGVVRLKRKIRRPLSCQCSMQLLVLRALAPQVTPSSIKETMPCRLDLTTFKCLLVVLWYCVDLSDMRHACLVHTLSCYTRYTVPPSGVFVCVSVFLSFFSLSCVWLPRLVGPSLLLAVVLLFVSDNVLIVACFDIQTFVTFSPFVAADWCDVCQPRVAKNSCKRSCMKCHDHDQCGLHPKLADHTDSYPLADSAWVFVEPDVKLRGDKTLLVPIVTGVRQPSSKKCQH